MPSEDLKQRSDLLGHVLTKSLYLYGKQTGGGVGGRASVEKKRKLGGCNSGPGKK